MRTINLNIQQSGVSNVGLFGYVKGASISYIKTAGTIVGGNATGGLVGCMENGEIFNCANSATVTGREQVGGIVGYNLPSQRGKIYGTIINDGAINGTNMVGGLVGQWHGEWNLNGTYGTFTNTGDVNGGTGASVGGIAGLRIELSRTLQIAETSLAVHRSEVLPEDVKHRLRIATTPVTLEARQQLRKAKSQVLPQAFSSVVSRVIRRQMRVFQIATTQGIFRHYPQAADI